MMQQRRWNIRMAAVLGLVNVLAAPGSAQDLQDLHRIKGSISDSHVEYHPLVIPKGSEVVLAELRGPGKVTYWYITDNTRGKWYPGLVLRVFWDDETDPSINVPLADFFGAIAGRTIDYQSLPMQINHLCYMCYLQMPFSQRARFVLRNDGDRDYSQRVAYGFDYEKSQEFRLETSRLHCSWRRSNPTQQSMHTILETRGRGHYVGNYLQVYSRYAGWWGEGDTIFHVDGKTITHAPGTEDEYGSCWEFGKLYQYLYSGYLENAGGENRMYRWYLANPVRFQESLKVEIQNQRNEKGQVPSQDDYTSIAFWYQEQRPGPVLLQSFAERTAPSRAAEYRKQSP
jgi:hypothetical protein